MRPQIFLSLLLLFNGLAFGQGSTSYSGYIDLYYMAHLSDNSLINLPYRMFDLTLQHKNENLDIYADLAMEYTPKSHSHFLSSSTPQDFLWDLRELYLTWYTNFGEIKIGKQIHTWGSVDENSPLDVVNAFDYYYLFFQGSDRKLGSYSAALNVYFNNWKFGAVVSPFHQTNRFPVNDPAFPISLPITPEEIQILDLEGNPFEFGAFLEHSFGIGDWRLSCFQGYDRIFNFTGVNTWGKGANLFAPMFDILFGYRKTSLLGFGYNFINSLFILRGDIGYFQTKDLNSNINHNHSDYLYSSDWGKYIETVPSTHAQYYILGYDSLHFSYPMREQSEYIQYTIQLESELPFDITFVGQFFVYDILNYSSNTLPTNTEENPLPVLENLNLSQFNPKTLFTPGMGAPLAVLSKRIMLLNLEKTFLDDQLKISFLSLFDIANPVDSTKTFNVWGSLWGFTAEYDVTQNLKFLLGITNPEGKDDHPDKELYRFNQMESFSHIRMEIKYFF
jgi:hypothetical protein